MQNLLKPPKLSAQTTLNRRSEKRGDSAFIKASLINTRAKVLMLVDLKVPIVPAADRSSAKLRWLSLSEVTDVAAEYVYLGEDETAAPIFVCNIMPAFAVSRAAELEVFKPLVDLRSLALQGVLPDSELLIAAQARGLLSWHAMNRCCSRCGARTRMNDGGWRRKCTACELDAYPRSDPAVIMLITHGDRCLLGHELRFPEKLYSTLAGFVEAGDDIEHAVRREIKEEANIDVGAVHYVASQPWPFPHQLMIGCWGEALTSEITIEPSELADVRWFTREAVAAMMAFSHPEGLLVPPSISMAHTLLAAFRNGTLPHYSHSRA